LLKTSEKLIALLLIQKSRFIKTYKAKEKESKEEVVEEKKEAPRGKRKGMNTDNLTENDKALSKKLNGKTVTEVMNRLLFI